MKAMPTQFQMQFIVNFRDKMQFSHHNLIQNKYLFFLQRFKWENMRNIVYINLIKIFYYILKLLTIYCDVESLCSLLHLEENTNEFLYSIV